jgi:hypothetical protein
MIVVCRLLITTRCEEERPCYTFAELVEMRRSMRGDRPDESAAIRQAEHTLDAFSVELWQTERRVGRFETIRAQLAQRKLQPMR